MIEQSETAPDLVVLSDLHLGEGMAGERGRTSPMEDFFYDDELARLLTYLSLRYQFEPRKLRLVLNGDCFDFLTVTRCPEGAEAPFPVDDVERHFGLRATATKSVYKLEQIVAGHPIAFRALARFVAAGHEVEILRGNHDLELFFEEVQNRLLELIAELDDELDIATLSNRVRFHQWFYLEPGRAYIEHGNQYEASNSIRYPLRPLRRRRSRSEREPVLDYPLGSLFVRYFYNSVHRLHPYTPKILSFEQYLEFLRRYNLQDLVRIAWRHAPSFAQALRPRAEGGSTGPSEPDEALQKQAFSKLDGEGAHEDLHNKLNELKIHPLSASKRALVREMTLPLLRKVIWVSLGALLSLYLWLLVFNMIQATTWLAENVFAKAVLLAIFSIGTLLALVSAGAYLGGKFRRQTDETVEMCAEQADEIARITGVELVLMGHTHVVDIRQIADGDAIYANSGTWTSVDNPWDRLHPDARRFTFLYVKEHGVTVSRWNDDAGRIDPVPLFDLSKWDEWDRWPLSVQPPKSSLG